MYRIFSRLYLLVFSNDDRSVCVGRTCKVVENWFATPVIKSQATLPKLPPKQGVHFIRVHQLSPQPLRSLGEPRQFLPTFSLASIFLGLLTSLDSALYTFSKLPLYNVRERSNKQISETIVETEE